MPIFRPSRAHAASRNAKSSGVSLWSAALYVITALWLIAPAGAADPGQMIQGTVAVAPGLAGQVAPGDRLIIKLYHPGEGVELDAKYRIVDEFMLPFDFVAAPSIDMSGQTKFQAYVLEVFTDKDEDVVRAAPGELVARTPEPVPLGTTGLVLELNARRE